MKPYIYFIIGCILVFISVNTVSAIDLNTLISYYSFDSSTSSDDHGVNNGTVIGTIISNNSCILGNCNYYNNGALNIGSDSSIDFTNSNTFSICEWVKTSDTTNFQRFFHKAKSSSDYDGIWFGKNDVGQGNTHYIQMYGNTGDIGKKSTSTFNDGTFHFVCFTYAGNNLRTGLKLYIDNIEQTGTSLSTTLGTMDTSTYNGYIGGDSLGGTLIGYIDEVSIWNKTLNTTELSELYNSGFGYNPIAPTPPKLESNIINNSLYSINDFNYNSGNGLVFYYNISNFETNNQCKFNSFPLINATRTDYNITTNKGIGINYINYEGWQTYQFICNDSTNYLNSTYQFYVDGIKPLFTTNFQNNYEFVKPYDTFDLNINFTGTPQLSEYRVYIYLDDNLQFNDTLQIENTTYEYNKLLNFSNLTKGSNILQINILDNSSNLNQVNYTFSILDSMSFYANKINQSDYIFNSNTYINTGEILFNTTGENQLFILYYAKNIEKLSIPVATDIIGKIEIDGIIQKEEIIRSLGSLNQVGVSGFQPFVFSVNAGQHNISFYIRETGNGNVRVFNRDIVLLQIKTNKDTFINSYDDDFNGIVNYATYTSIGNIEIDSIQDLNVNAFIGLNSTITTTAEFYFKNLESGEQSQIYKRSLSSGQKTNLYMNWFNTGKGNYTLFAKGNMGLNSEFAINNFFDSDYNYIKNSNNLNESKVYTTSQTIQEINYINYNGNQSFITGSYTYQGLTGEQTPKISIYNNNVLCTEKERTLSSEFANIYFYTICPNMSINSVNNIIVNLTLESGEQLNLTGNLILSESEIFEITQTNIKPFIFSYSNLSTNITSDENVNAIISCDDVDNTNLLIEIEWYVNNINLFSDSKSTTPLSEDVFILLSNYINANDEVYYKARCFDNNLYSDYVQSNTITIQSGTSDLSTELLQDIKNELINLGGFINMIVIGIIILTFIIAGILIKKYELWLISGIMLGIVGIFYKTSVSADYSDWILITSVISGVLICIMGIIFSVMQNINMDSEEKINKSFYKNVYNK